MGVERLPHRAHQCAVCATWHYPPRPDDTKDPANGERVARCLSCGIPRDVHRFALTLHGKRAGSVLLCGRCFYSANPMDPQAGDPLRA